MSEGMHTPGEIYRYRDEEGDTIALAIMGKGPNGGHVGRDIARMPVPYGRLTRAEIEANAARLMLCWNMHDELVGALNELREFVRDWQPNFTRDDEDWPAARARIDAALAKARATQDPDTTAHVAEREGS